MKRMKDASVKAAKLAQEYRALVEVANIYFSDGAPRAAADRLRAAADVAEQLANFRDDFFGVAK